MEKQRARGREGLTGGETEGWRDGGMEGWRDRGIEGSWK